MGKKRRREGRLPKGTLGGTVKNNLQAGRLNLVGVTITAERYDLE